MSIDIPRHLAFDKIFEHLKPTRPKKTATQDRVTSMNKVYFGYLEL